MNAKIVKLQYSIFFNNPIYRTSSVAIDVISKHGKIFDSELLNIPLPENAPTNITASQLKSSDEKWIINISRERIDFFWQYLYDEKEADFKEIRDFFLKVIDLCLQNDEIKQTKINRISNVITHEIEESNSIDLIQQKLLAKRFDNIHDIKLRFNQREDVEEFKVNNITNIESVMTKDIRDESVPEERKFFIQKDINTRQDLKNQEFNVEQIKAFYNYCEKYLLWENVEKIFN